ncbi:MAG: hypothetical protein EXS08_13115 [Planctomycetes bacterium]|nr:hypothetical protein [Planctomycetota bacterium]
MPIVVILSVLAVAALLLWLTILSERKRLAAFQVWAADHGWRFDPARIRNPDLEYELFQRGHSRYLCFSALKTFPAPTPGLEPVQLRLFEYHYAVTRSTGKTTYTESFHFTCALLLPGLDLGHVALRPEGLGDKLVQALGFDDIDLEDPEFSKRYVVQARERREAYDLFDGPMMRFLGAREAPQLETRGRELFVCVERKPEPSGYEALAAFVLEFLAQLPRPLVNAERARRGLAPLLEAGNASSASRGALAELEGDHP